MGGSPWEQMPMQQQAPEAGGMGGVMSGVPEDKRENMLDEILHNYILMPQMAKAKEMMKQNLVQQYMGGMQGAEEQQF